MSDTTKICPKCESINVSEYENIYNDFNIDYKTKTSTIRCRTLTMYTCNNCDNKYVSDKNSIKKDKLLKLNKKETKEYRKLLDAKKIYVVSDEYKKIYDKFVKNKLCINVEGTRWFEIIT